MNYVKKYAPMVLVVIITLWVIHRGLLMVPGGQPIKKIIVG